MLKLHRVEYLSHSREETLLIARNWAATLPAKALVTFQGDLGAGKTTFIKGLVSQACAIDEDEVSSPTFSLLHLYRGKHTAYHYDLYRLGEEDFFHLGFDEQLQEKALFLIEWAEKIAPYLPQERFEVIIEAKDETTRLISILSPQPLSTP